MSKILSVGYHLSIFNKCLLATLAIYVGVSYGLHLFDQPSLFYRHPNPISSQINILQRPFMEIAGDSRFGNFLDWQEMEYASLENTSPILISTKRSRAMTNKQNAGWNSLTADASANSSGLQEVVILEPIHHRGNWSLAYCQNDNTCKVNNIVHSGQIKTTVNPNRSRIWGVDEARKPIAIRVVRYATRQAYQNIVFIG